MDDYKKLYFLLFNEISDTIARLELNLELLKSAQIKAEQLFISQGDEKNGQA